MNSDLYSSFLEIQNKIYRLRSSDIDQDYNNLIELLFLQFPKCNKEFIRSKYKTVYDLLSIFDQTLLKPETLDYFFDLINKSETNKVLIIEENPSPFWTFFANCHEVFKVNLFCENQETKDLFVNLFSNAKIATIKQTFQKYDLVLINGIFSNFKENRTIYDIQNKSIPNKIEVIKPVFDFLAGCEFLDKNGVMIIFSTKTRLLLEKIIKYIPNDLNITAIFQTPNSKFYRGNPIYPQILLLKNEEINDTVYLGKLEELKEQQKLLFKNFHQNKITQSVRTGRRINLKDFTAIDSIYANEIYEKLALKYGGTLIEIKELIIDNEWRRLLNKEINERYLNSSVFIPLFNCTKAVETDIDKTDTKQLVQINLDSSKIIPEFFAQVLNQEIGIQLRKSCSDGAAIQELKQNLFFSAKFPLPSKSNQMKIVELNNKMNEAIFTIKHIQQNLWVEPSKYDAIISHYKKRFHEPKEEEWIEILPFHIASILKLYYASSNLSKKYECLFLFFEATAQFLANVLLSSFVTDKDFLNTYCNNIVSSEEKYKNWYLRTDFGGWINLYANLASSARKCFNHKEQDVRELTQCVFGYPSKVQFENITNSSITSILKSVNEKRNNWKGHGGITSDKIHKERIGELELNLSQIKEYLINAFDTCLFHVAGRMVLKDGIYKVQTSLLKGSNSIFKEETIEVTSGLEEGSQYFIHTNQNKAIRLLPLVRLMSSPNSAQNACYYYNKMEGDSVRLVSYHFENKSDETIEADSEFLSTIELLKPN